MKLFITLLATALLSCAEPVMLENYRLAAPEIPELWEKSFGRPVWRFVWTDPDGVLKSADSLSAVYPNADIANDRFSPVLAYPFWPERGLSAEVMRPAGALFPLDLSGDTVKLSFQGGVDARFYLELALYESEKRPPGGFDWARFRRLWTDGKLDGEVQADPWLVDWADVAEKTAAAGFSTTKLKARPTENLIITVPSEGPWVGTSPFTPAWEWEAGAKMILRVTSGIDTYFCPKGSLRVTRKLAVWYER
ncbi:MAG: hypothetical protein LBC77_08710 [Spirochaetaceae bacterium]|jgi:hypothetical protein|nr:hypothetical protein [Spirochaetaceae bacterium]